MTKPDTDRVQEFEIRGWKFFEKDGQWYHLSSSETEDWATTAVCRALLEAREERDRLREELSGALMGLNQVWLYKGSPKAVLDMVHPCIQLAKAALTQEPQEGSQ